MTALAEVLMKRLQVPDPSFAKPAPLPLENNVVNAPILIKKFWNQHPKFKNATKLSESTHELDTNTELLKVPSQKNTLAKNKTKSQKSKPGNKRNSELDSFTKQDTVDTDEQDDLSKVYHSIDSLSRAVLDKASWENDVVNIETMEASATGEDDLAVYINWKNGKKTVVSSKVANTKCPQKIIKFYENHIKFG
ncbi:Chromobox protein 5 [Batrachochytrium dendrobatidis]|nr:Chromobox protein 5 [Batrachochytrium dendrobatidis]